MRDRRYRKKTILIFFLIILFSSITLIPYPESTMIDHASASSSWVQTSDEDFDEGIHFNTTIFGEEENSNVILDIAQTPHWTKKSPSGKPSGRSFFDMATIYGTDKVLLFGGFLQNNNNDNETWVYDLSDNKWTNKLPKISPKPRSRSRIAPFYGTKKVILFGGYNQTPLNDTWIYDLENNTWEKKNTINSPLGRMTHSLETIPYTDKVMLFGGYEGGVNKPFYNDTWIYDLSNNTWTNVTSLTEPIKRAAHATAYIDGTDKILLFGGFYRPNLTYSKTFDDTWIYDFSENKWTRIFTSNTPRGRTNHIMFTVFGTDKVVSFAGMNGTYLVDINIFDYNTSSWTYRNPMERPAALSIHSMASVDGTDQAIFFGGWSGTTRDETWLYDNSIQSMKGFYRSPKFHTYTTPNYKTIKWNDFTPPGTFISLQFKTAPYNTWLDTRNFVGPDGTPSSYYTTTPATIWNGHNGDAWMQFRVYFSTNNLPTVPYISDITIIYNWLPGIPELLAPSNDTWLKDNRPEFKWNFTDQDSNTQGGFQWQADDDINFSTIDYDSAEVNSNSTTYSPIHPISDGVWYWRVRTKDSDGDWGEFSKGNVIRIDTTIDKPIDILVEPDAWTPLNSFNINWENPNDLTGIAGAYYKLDNIPKFNEDGNFILKDKINSIKGIQVNGDGEHILYIWLKDTLGNVNNNMYGYIKLYLDSFPPQKPENIIITPSNWTDENSFSISWENPNDLSGIGGVYYKFKYAPNFDIDGTYLSGNDIHFIENISVNENGEHTIFIWLHDNVGNVNYKNYNIVKFYFDDTAPPKPNDLVITPNNWTSVNSFTIDWINPVDLSGVENGAYCYISDTPPSSQLDGTWIPNKPIIIENAHEGENLIHIWLEDNVGNYNHLNYNIGVLKLDTEPPKIIHKPVTNAIEKKEIIIEAEIIDELSGIDEVFLYYKNSTDEKYKKLMMVKESDNYSIKIPLNELSFDGVEYYIKTSDKSMPKNINYFGAEGETELEPTELNDINIVISPLPKIIENSPVGLNISADSNIYIYFNKIMSANETKNAFSITPSIKGILTYNNKKLNFLPNVPLAYNTTYTVIISTTAIDHEGNNLPEEFKWSFTTEDEADLIEPEHKKQKDNQPNTFVLTAIIGFCVLVILVIIIIFIHLRKKRSKNNINNDPIQAQTDTGTQTSSIISSEIIKNYHNQQLNQLNQLAEYPDYSQQQSYTQLPQRIQQNLCSICGQQMSYIQQNNKYYCYHCKKYD